MVGYVKRNFFVRYRAFDSWAQLNQLAEQWLHEEADQRFHGMVREVVAVRFEREQPALGPLPRRRYDTFYWELRQAGAGVGNEDPDSRRAPSRHLTVANRAAPDHRQRLIKIIQKVRKKVAFTLLDSLK